MHSLKETISAAAGAEGVPSALAASRDGVDSLLRDRGVRRTTPTLVAESLLRGAAASAQLAGSSTGLEALRHGEGDVLARGAARLNAGVLALAPVVGRSPLQALARLHTLAAADLVAADQLGRPRSGDGVAARLQALSGCLQATSGLPAIVVAAVAHAEIATIEPFETGNGLVGRALERLVLVARGVDPSSMLVPEAGHAALADGYRAALAAYATGSVTGVRTWLLHCAAALTVAAEASPRR